MRILKQLAFRCTVDGLTITTKSMQRCDPVLGSTAHKCCIWIVNIIYLRYADILQYVVIVENLQSMLADT